jgi:hypothetical protein
MVVAKMAMSELSMGVLPIAAENASGKTFVLATGFIIRANGRQAYLVTAAHVVREIRKMERPNPRHHPSTPAEFISVEYRVGLPQTTPLRSIAIRGEELAE